MDATPGLMALKQMCIIHTAMQAESNGICKVFNDVEQGAREDSRHWNRL